jgi:hypothetical protein
MTVCMHAQRTHTQTNKPPMVEAYGDFVHTFLAVTN